MVKAIRSQPILVAAVLVMVFALILTSAGCGSSSQEAAPISAEARANNNVPVIDVVMPEWTAIERNGVGLVRCIAHDPDGDALTYSWETNRGSISGEGTEITFTAPGSYVDIVIDVSVSDGISRAMAGVTFKVVCCGHAQKNPEWVE